MCCSREEKFSAILYDVNGNAILVNSTQVHLIEIHADNQGLFLTRDDVIINNLRANEVLEDSD